MKLLGLKFKTHYLRKMYGSFLIAQGENIVTVSRWMGHADPSITLKAYAKMMTDDQVGSKRALNLPLQSNKSLRG